MGGIVIQLDKIPYSRFFDWLNLKIVLNLFQIKILVGPCLTSGSCQRQSE